MLNLLAASVKPLTLNRKVLEAAYELYLAAPEATYPIINLRELSRRTGASLLECRNAIIEAHHHGRFPQCALES